MPDNYRNSGNIFRKIADRVVYILTGEKPRRRRHRSPAARPAVRPAVQPEVSPAVIDAVNPKQNETRKPVIHRKKRQKPVRKVWRKFKNLFRGKQEKQTGKEPVINRPLAGNYVQNFTVSDAADPTRPASRDLASETRPAKIKRHKSRKRSSFFKQLFGEVRNERSKQNQETVFTDELKKALKEEGYPLLNSLGFYILAYLTVYLIYQFTEALVAANFNIDSVLFYYEIYFPIGNASPLWSRFNIILITLASPFMSIIVSVFLLRVILMKEKLNPQLRLFLLWVAFHGATHFLGAFVAGIATSQGFGYVANWLFMNVFFRILVSLIFLFLLTIIGYYSAVFALETIPAGIRQHRWRLSLALGSRLILPWILGGIFVVVVKYPDSIPQHPNIAVYDAIIIASMGFMVIPAFFNFKAKPRSVAERPRRHRRPPGFWVLLLAVVAMILFRMAFERGIHLIIHFSFDVGYYR